MAFQSVPDTAEMTIVGEMAGELIINTYHAKKEGGYTLTDLTDLAHVGDLWWDSDMQVLVGTQYTYLRTHVQGLNAAIDLEAEDSTHTGSVGTQSGGGLSNNATVSIKRSSGFTGRGARGRVFWPALTEDILLDTTHVTSVWLDGVVTALDNLKDAINDAGWLHVIVHRVAAGVVLSPAQTFEVIQYVGVDNAIDSMRRRLAGRGV